MDFAELSEQSSREILSSIHYDQGDISSSKKEYIDAIIAYNKSMCYSMGNANIIKTRKRRIESEYLANSSMKSQMFIDKNDSEFNHLDLLILSYKANPSLPFMADCVDIVKNEDGSIVLIAKIPLNVGDVIAVETSFCNGLGNDSRYENCSNCMKKAPFALIPCDNCTNGEENIMEI